MENENKYSIMVGTPCYGGLLHQDHVKGLLEYGQLGIPLTCVHIGNESILPRGRNTIISIFNKYKDKFSHLLFLDADVYLPVQGLVQMLQADKDVIASPVPMKGFDINKNLIYNVNNVLETNIPDNPNLVTVDRIGTAALLLSNKAVSALIEYAEQNNYTYNPSSLSRGASVQDMTCYDVFRTPIINNEYLGEDHYCCLTLRNLGFDIYVDKTIGTLHSGSYSFGG